MLGAPDYMSEPKQIALTSVPAYVWKEGDTN